MQATVHQLYSDETVSIPAWPELQELFSYTPLPGMIAAAVLSVCSAALA